MNYFLTPGEVVVPKSYDIQCSGVLLNYTPLTDYKIEDIPNCPNCGAPRDDYHCEYCGPSIKQKLVEMNTTSGYPLT